MNRMVLAFIAAGAIALAGGARGDVVQFCPPGNADAVHGLLVNGHLFDVTFPSGNYNDVFGTTPPIDFAGAGGWPALKTATEALAAALNAAGALTVGPCNGPNSSVFIFSVFPPDSPDHFDGTLLGRDFDTGLWLHQGYFGGNPADSTLGQVWAVYSAAPEPGTLALVAVALLGVVAVRRQRRNVVPVLKSA